MDRGHGCGESEHMPSGETKMKCPGRPAGAFSTVSRDDDYCGLLMSSFFMSSFLVVSFLLDLLFLAFFSVLSPLSAFLSIVLSLLPASWASAKEDIERVRATAN